MASSAPPSLPAPPVCNRDGFGFEVERSLDLACDANLFCHGDAHLRVRNCRAASLAAQFHLSFPERVVNIELAPIAPGRDVSYPVHLGREESPVVSARFSTDDGLDAAIVSTLHVTASARDRARAECDACHGDWGRHGMLGLEGCLCRMADAGRECEDARDCEGECVATGHRIVRQGHPPRRLANGTIPVAETLVVAVGRCSEFRAQFGCHAYVPEGARESGPQPLRLLPLATICRD
jgi:hypothetical protein